MFAIVQNGEIVKTSGSIKSLFPNMSFSARGASAEFKAANNVMEVVDGEQKDQRFYWVTPANPSLQLINGVPTRVYTNTAKELEDRLETKEDGSPLYVQVYNPETEQMEDTTEQVVTKGLKSQFIAQVKEAANTQLAQTDWYVVRKFERNVDIPENIVAQRAAIVSDTEAKQQAIAACTTVEELMQVI